MKSKKLILGITIAAILGLSVTAYAENTSKASSTTGCTSSTKGCTSSTSESHQKVGLKKATGIKGYDYIKLVLTDKLNMTDGEIQEGLNSGKSLFDMANEKGISEEDFKAAVLEERNNGIDKAVENGTITSEEATKMKGTLKSNMDSCTGIPGENKE